MLIVSSFLAILFKSDYVFCIFYFVVREGQVFLDLDFALGPFGFYLFGDGKGECLFVGRFERAGEFLSRAGEYLDFVADVFLILSDNLERRGDAGRPHFELVVFDFAVEAALDEVVQGGAAVYVYTFVVVDFDDDAVVGRYGDVYDKQVGALYALVNDFCYGLGVNHMAGLSADIKRGDKLVPSLSAHLRGKYSSFLHSAQVFTPYLWELWPRGNIFLLFFNTITSLSTGGKAKVAEFFSQYQLVSVAVPVADVVKPGAVVHLGEM